MLKIKAKLTPIGLAALVIGGLVLGSIECQRRQMRKQSEELAEEIKSMKKVVEDLRIIIPTSTIPTSTSGETNE